MEILLSFDNGKNKHLPEFACISQRIQMDDFDEAKFDEQVASFKAKVKKQTSSESVEALLAGIPSAEEPVIA